MQKNNIWFNREKNFNQKRNVNKEQISFRNEYIGCYFRIIRVLMIDKILHFILN